jgi:hypothetical protein
MVSSLKNEILIFAMSFVMIGCATSRYHANPPNALGTDIEVTPDRIVLQCEFISDYDGHDYSDPYGFMIHLLDNQKTVLTVSNASILEKRDCFERLMAAEKIINNGEIIVVRGRGDADAPIKMEEFSHNFSKHGHFYSNGRSLNYLAIWNEKGQCYDAYYGPDKPCPRGRDDD